MIIIPNIIIDIGHCNKINQWINKKDVTVGNTDPMNFMAQSQQQRWLQYVNNSWKVI